MTKDLPQRLREHYWNRGKKETFAGRYYCYNLVYFEHTNYVNNAIARETQLKTWSRKKKDALITEENPGWRFLNEDVCEEWPPTEVNMRY